MVSVTDETIAVLSFQPTAITLVPPAVWAAL
jgi:hypothetical protein